MKRDRSIKPFDKISFRDPSTGSGRTVILPILRTEFIEVSGRTVLLPFLRAAVPAIASFDGREYDEASGRMATEKSFVLCEKALIIQDLRALIF